MVHLDITAEEREILRDVLDGVLSDLRMEIASTDSQDFRDRLKRRKAVLEKTLGSLAAPASE